MRREKEGDESEVRNAMPDREALVITMQRTMYLEGECYWGPQLRTRFVRWRFGLMEPGLVERHKLAAV